jgi:hypothetical protein
MSDKVDSADPVESGRVVDDSHNIYAIMSDAVYGDAAAVKLLNGLGWRSGAQTESKKYQAFGKDGKIVIAFRGTQDPTDVWNDANIAIGTEKTLPDFRRARKITQKAIDKYGKDNVTLTGHSMGGTTALYANSITGVPTVTFAPGIGLGMVVDAAKERAKKSIFNTPIKENNQIYATKTDIVSHLAKHTNAHLTYLPASAGNAHTIKNFMDYKRLNKAGPVVKTYKKKKDVDE